jgi:hypothetical protein
MSGLLRDNCHMIRGTRDAVRGSLFLGKKSHVPDGPTCVVISRAIHMAVGHPCQALVRLFASV